jgi:hypothetical protein
MHTCHTALYGRRSLNSSSCATAAACLGCDESVCVHVHRRPSNIKQKGGNIKQKGGSIKQQGGNIATRRACLDMNFAIHTSLLCGRSWHAYRVEAFTSCHFPTPTHTNMATHHFLALRAALDTPIGLLPPACPSTPLCAGDPTLGAFFPLISAPSLVTRATRTLPQQALPPS